MSIKKRKKCKIFTILSILPLIFLSNNIYPQNKETTTKELKITEKEFEKNYQMAIKAASKQISFSVHFKQEVFSVLRDKIVNSEGVLSIKKPTLFRFEVDSPRQELYVSNGKSFWKYIPELKHAQHLQANSAELSFVSLLTNLAHLKKFYQVSPWNTEEAKKLKQEANIPLVKSDTPPAQDDDYILLKMVPKGDKQQKVLYAVIQVKTGFIQELRIVQLNGNRTRLVFSEYSPKSIPDGKFEFTPPSGYRCGQHVMRRNDFLDTIKTIISWKALVDISLVAVLFYQIISMLKGTRAAQVLIGMLVIFIAYVFSSVLQFETLHWIISKFYSSFIIVVIVLFQDDIRRLLTRFGRGPFVSGLDIISGSNIIDEITNAAKSLSHERIGALIVFERSVGLDKLYDHSIMLDSMVSEQLLSSIFQSFSPLHDGAVIIKKDRINCASAQLPLSKNPRFSKKMGTRHSAAVGISEETDAVVLVVSEETGNISIAWEGNLQRQSSVEAARKMLSILLIPRSQKSNLVHWLENKIIFKYHRFLINIKSIFYPSKNTPFENERKKQLDKAPMQKKVSSLESLALQQIEQENRIASNSPRNIYIRFPRGAKIKDIKTPEMQFITSNILNKQNHINIKKNEDILEPDENINNEEEMNREDETKETETSEKNKALKALVDLAPEDRFDPPIPKSPPPRDVSIGGIPLDPPIEKKKENETQDKNNKEDKK